MDKVFPSDSPRHLQREIKIAQLDRLLNEPFPTRSEASQATKEDQEQAGQAPPGKFAAGNVGESAAHMKVLAIMNGWKESPHQWWRYLLLPFAFNKTPQWISVSVFGFVFFIG